MAIFAPAERLPSPATLHLMIMQTAVLLGLAILHKQPDAWLWTTTFSVFSVFDLRRGLLSPSGDLGIGLVWDNNRTGPDSFLVRLMKSSSNWTKLFIRGPQLFSGSYQMILGVFRCSQLFSDVFRLFSDDVFRLLNSSSSWTKLSMMGPQLFSGWYYMI